MDVKICLVVGAIFMIGFAFWYAECAAKESEIDTKRRKKRK